MKRSTLWVRAAVSLCLLLGCGGLETEGADDLFMEQQALDNQPTPSEPDRCRVSRDSSGEDLGDGTIDVNGFCCVQNSGKTTCYGCGSGFTCSSIPSRASPKPPRGTIIGKGGVLKP